MLREITWVGLKVADLGAAGDFYVKRLGVAARFEHAFGLRLDTQWCDLDLVPGGRARAGGSLFLSFHVQSAHQAAEALRERGVQTGAIKEERWGGFTAFRDPEHNRWMVAHSVDLPPVKGNQLRRIGWLSILGQDSEALIAFYRDVLGVPLVETRKGWARYNTSGPMLEIFPAGKASPKPRRWGEQAAFLPRFRVDDVDHVADELRRAGVRLTHQGQAEPRSLEFADPEGNPWQVSEA